MPDVRYRDEPDRLVLSRVHRGVAQPAVPDLIERAIGELTDAAVHCGGTAAPPFVVFHDAQYRPTDITFEVCVPVRAAPDVALGDEVRVEPAHRQAYVRLTRARSEPAEVGRWYAYVADAVGDRAAGGPREIYFADVLSAGPDDEVCDVAFPVL